MKANWYDKIPELGVLPPGLHQGESSKEVGCPNYPFLVSDFLTYTQKICLIEKPDSYRMKGAFEPGMTH